MTTEENNLSLKEVQKKIMVIKLVTMPAAVALGLGLYGVFAAKGNAFHPLLNSMDFSYTLIAVGLVIEAIGTFKLIPLFKLHKQLAPSNE